MKNFSCYKVKNVEIYPLVKETIIHSFFNLNNFRLKMDVLKYL